MDLLNYHRLYYFWIVAKEGSVTQASRKLFISQSTVSGQLALLEDEVGEALFERRGRNLELTEAGQIALKYANEIFPLGNELLRALKGQHQPQQINLRVGVSNVLPKLLVHRFLKPVGKMGIDVRLEFTEESQERLLSELATHKLDVVLSDAPAGSGMRGRAFSHLLGASDIGFFAHSSLAKKAKSNFPKSLDNMPLLLPSNGTALRRSLDIWFEREKLSPRVVGEFDDSALMKIYGQEGLGVFPAPNIISKDVTRQYAVEKVGEARAVRERFYAISMERKLKHPAVVAITEAATN